MEAVISGYALIGKPASFAVNIIDNLGSIHKRVVPLKLKSKYQAELAAIKYVCQAIPHKDVELVIKTAVSQIPQIFVKAADGRWPKRKKANKLVDEVRELTSQFETFSCVLDKDSETMLEIKKLAKQPNSI